MAAYDVFLDNEQPEYAQKLLINNASRLLKYTFKKYDLTANGNADILEIGPGKGYFHAAVEMGGYGNYYAMDRNSKMLQSLGIDSNRVIESALPNIPTDQKFDLIFVGFVIEHLTDGIQLFDSLESLKGRLKDGGIIVLQFPDCMKLGAEFYNIDYTHSLPTTKRNVNQAVIDAGMRVDKCVDISGILYTRVVDSKVLYYLRRLLLFFYNYRFFNAISRIVYRTPLWDLQNVFWRAYALLKEPNAMFFVKK